jgi:type II secretory pathway component PulF
VRTTVTLDADTEQLIRQRMRERRVTFKQALNDAIRDGLSGPRTQAGFRTKTVSMGQPAVPLDRALQLAGELEDAELIRRMEVGR